MATIVSAQDGLWSATTTWTGGVCPAAADTVTIRHKVTMDLNDQAAATIYGRINIESNQTIYSTGTCTCSGTTVYGSGTSWTSAHIGQYIILGDGSISKITAVTDATHLTINTSRDIPIYSNYFITSYYGQLIHADGTTCFASNMWLYINGGRYEMKPGSTVKFKTTSKTSGTEGVGLAGIQADGVKHGTQLICNGSLPMPETYLTADVDINGYILPVADASGFAEGEYIAVYHDISGDQNWYWSGPNQNDEGFIIHHISGNNIYVRNRVGIEDTLAQNVAIGQNYAIVNNVRKWQPFFYTYIDDEVFDIASIDEANNKIIFNNTATVAHTAGANLYQTGCIQPNKLDTVTSNASVGATYISLTNPSQFTVNEQISIDGETLTISSVDIPNSRIAVSPVTTKFHSYNAWIKQTNNKSHLSGDKVYKIATIVTVSAAAAATSITVANASMLNVGDRICIEGAIRGYDKITETTISAKSGNVLTLATGLVTLANPGFIVTKTNRDCVITTTDTADLNRATVYYVSGSNAYIGRKCVLRYCEASHIGNNASSLYSGVAIRSDFSRRDNEREVRGVVARDGWNTDWNGISCYSGHYAIFRNNICIRTYNGFHPYDSNGCSFYNNLAMGCYAAGFRVEHQYHYNQFQYNIGLNNPYGVMQYSLYTAIYPIMGNIFKHATYSIVMDISAYAGQFGPWIKNKFNDIQYRQISSAMSRQIFQDIEITYASDATNSTYDSDYSNSDMRGTTGAVIIVNKDYIRGNFQMHSMGGWYDKDEAVHMGNGWSYKGTVNRADRDLRISQMVYVKYGVPVTVTAYMKKNSSYNGLRLPHIMVQGKFLNYQVKEMANVNDQWDKVELTFTPARSEMVEIAVGGRGTAGNFWIDPRVRVTTFDLDLIQGPYSVNLMFGLEEIYAGSPNVILSGTTLG